MKVVIDRVEATLAVMFIVDTEFSFELPLTYLPDGVKAGDYLEVEFTLDLPSRKAAEKRISDLLKELSASDTEQKDFKL